MTDSLEQRIIDALVDDIEASAGLPIHTVVRYRRPRAVLPEELPMLVVWLASKETTPITTIRFSSTIQVGVSWHEQSVEEAETLVQDTSIGLALMTNIALIEDRVRAIETAGGLPVPEAQEMLPSGTVYETLQDGLVEGYALSVLVRVTEE